MKILGLKNGLLLFKMYVWEKGNLVFLALAPFSPHFSPSFSPTCRLTVVRHHLSSERLEQAMRVTVTMVTTNYQPVEKKGAISENVMVLLLNCK